MNKLIAEILSSIALKFFDRAAKGPKHVKGKGPGKLEKRLREKLKKQISVIFICFSFLVVGCVNKVIYVPHGKAVKLRQDIKKPDIWAQDESGEWLPGVIERIPNGWYCLPFDEDDDN